MLAASRALCWKIFSASKERAAPQDAFCFFTFYAPRYLANSSSGGSPPTEAAQYKSLGSENVIINNRNYHSRSPVPTRVEGDAWCLIQIQRPSKPYVIVDRDYFLKLQELASGRQRSSQSFSSTASLNRLVTFNSFSPKSNSTRISNKGMVAAGDEQENSNAHLNYLSDSSHINCSSYQSCPSSSTKQKVVGVQNAKHPQQIPPSGSVEENTLTFGANSINVKQFLNTHRLQPKSPTAQPEEQDGNFCEASFLTNKDYGREKASSPLVRNQPVLCHK